MPSGSLNRRVAQKLADHRLPLPGANGGRCELMPEVVDADILQAGPGSDPLPERLNVGEPCAEKGPDDRLRFFSTFRIASISRDALLESIIANVGLRRHAATFC